jgi:hypothetical protein
MYQIYLRKYAHTLITQYINEFDLLLMHNISPYIDMLHQAIQY